MLVFAGLKSFALTARRRPGDDSPSSDKSEEKKEPEELKEEKNMEMVSEMKKKKEMKPRFFSRLLVNPRMNEPIGLS